jgi:hypothetical protein
MFRAAGLVVISMLLASTATAGAQPIKYWGRNPADATGVISPPGGPDQAVQVGTEVPGLGRVKAITDDEITFEHYLSEDEKAQLRAQGYDAPDVVETQVMHEAHRYLR